MSAPFKKTTNKVISGKVSSVPSSVTISLKCDHLSRATAGFGFSFPACEPFLAVVLLDTSTFVLNKRETQMGQH